MEINENKDRIKSVDKALDILEFLSKNEQEIGISEISKKLNMGLSTVHRILFTLKSRGYVIQNQKTIKYRLGIKLFELGCKVQNSKNLIKIVKPYLRELSRITNETVNLAILEGKDVVYLDTIESTEALRTGIVPGTRTVAHCTALGKVILAHLPNGEFVQLYRNDDNMISLTKNSISSKDELKKELRKAKENGYALDREESIEGINCVGSPILNGQGEPVAAISITGPASRFTMDKIENAKNELIMLSKEISNLYYNNNNY